MVGSQPQISVIARDRGGGYAVAAQRALPHAIQVADRWHLMENASRAFLDAVGKSMRQIRKTIGAGRIDPKLLTFAERLQYEGFQRREETNASILSLSQEGARYERLCAERDTAEAWSARFCAVSVRTSSARDPVRLNPICLGWTPNGTPDAEMALRYGEPCESAVFAAAAGSLSRVRRFSCRRSGGIELHDEVEEGRSFHGQSMFEILGGPNRQRGAATGFYSLGFEHRPIHGT